MKTRSLLLSVFLILAVLILIGSGETKKKAYEAKEDEELYGTWLNSEYYVSGDTPWPPVKIIYKPNGTFDYYEDVGDQIHWWGTYTITDSWNDAEGNIWFKLTWKVPAISEVINYQLCKISNSGNVMERTNFNLDYPPEINPNSYRYGYWIYYRQ